MAGFICGSSASVVNRVAELKSEAFGLELES